MAKKNEILLSIALENDADIKAKLKSIGDVGKASLANIEKNIADAGKTFGKLPEGGGLQKALAPLAEASGLQGALSGITGMLSRFGGVLAGGGIPAGLAAIGSHLAKINAETEATEQRLKSLGAAEGVTGRLRKSARAIDAEPKDLAAGVEDFLPFKRRQELTSPYGVSDVSEAQFLTAQRALVAGGKVDRLQTPDAVAKANNFLRGILQPHDVGDGTTAPGLASGGLSGLSPSAANRVARAIGGQLGVPFRNADELQLFLEQKDKQGRSPIIKPATVFDALKQDEPAARAEAEKHRTVGDANDRVKGRLGDIQDSLSDIFGPPSGKAATGFTDTVSEGLRHIRERVDANKPVADAFGASGRDLGERTGIPGLGRAGELVGTAEGFGFGILRDAAKGYGVLGGQIGDALGLRPPPQPQVSPDAPYGFLQPLQQRELEQQRIRDQMQQSPQQPVPQSQPAVPQPQAEQPATLGSRTEAAPPPQQVADVSGALQRILEGFSAALNGGKKENLDAGPDTQSIGIRGEAENAAPSNVAAFQDAAGMLAKAMADAASSIASSAQNAQSSSKSADAAPTTQKVQAAAGGGEIRRNLDGGGHVSGPGTTTSDSIPAMLSDKEYVIKASSAQKIGRANLDWLNSGNFAGGGEVARKVQKLADGGFTDDTVARATLAGIEAGKKQAEREREEKEKLSPGDHQIAYDPTTGGAYIDGVLHTPGDPLLNDPNVKQAIEASKASLKESPKSKYKSPFVGRFGHSDDSDTYVKDGGPIGHFAGGGVVGKLPLFARRFALGGPASTLSGTISLPPMLSSPVGFDGIDVGHGSAPLLSGGPGAGSGDHYTVDLRTNTGDYSVKAEKSVVDQMKSAARDASLTRIGRAPSWHD
ncbi:hypothetical protein H8A99_13305 [Bradyrhizobium sp. Arg68]|uniref:hypothetical protein n=1 Tax=Bradyrhizobium ivorense TaxID=2511166 RepID=UPI001E35113D|nr:hypothetical protein [Bradyrhizobium ivorense]MCC8937423.1 hypothetical protein [Bradyrhizobium ivorense]